MLKIAGLCDEILEQLTVLGLTTAKAMLPGLSRDEVLHRTRDLPFVLPESAVQLYMWSEGVGAARGLDVELFPYNALEKLSNSVSMFEQLSRAPDFPRFRRDDKTWFPLFQSSGTDFFGITCNSDGADDAEIIDDYNVGEPRVAFIGLEAMLKTILDCYKSKVYSVGENGNLVVGEIEENALGQIVNVDMTRFNQIARRHNPGLSY